MNKLTSLLLAMLIVITGVFSLSTVSYADYQYTVRIYLGGTGNEGAFFTEDADALYIDTKVQSGDSYTFVPEDEVKISSTDAKYRVVGARRSGGNDLETTINIPKVTEDATFVIAYGVYKTIPYKAVFKDKAGNVLAPEETYYGIKDREFYVPYKEINNYFPATTELKKPVTLTESGQTVEFIYTDRKGSTSYVQDGDSVSYSTVIGDPTYTYQTIPGMPAEEEGVTDNRVAGGQPAGGEAGGAEAGETEDTTQIGEAEVPLGGEGENTPTSIPEPEGPKGKDRDALYATYLHYLIIIALLGLLILFITIIGIMKVNYDKNHKN